MSWKGGQHDSTGEEEGTLSDICCKKKFCLYLILVLCGDPQDTDPHITKVHENQVPAPNQKTSAKCQGASKLQ